MPKCADCEKLLTADEIEYYGYTCNTCEGRWMDRLDKDMHEGIAESTLHSMDYLLPAEDEKLQ